LALLRRTIVVLYGEQDAPASVVLARQTADLAYGISNVLASLALLHLAEGHAMASDRRACEAALIDAKSCSDHITADDPAIDLFSASQFGRMAGSCFLALRDHSRAQTVLEAAAASLADQSKAHTVMLGNLALAAIGQGKLDEATARLHQTIDAIDVNWSGGGLNLVFSASRELRPWWDEPVVQDVQDRLLGLVAVN
jgi:hypothetical protein